MEVRLQLSLEWCQMSETRRGHSGWQRLKEQGPEGGRAQVVKRGGACEMMK